MCSCDDECAGACAHPNFPRRVCFGEASRPDDDGEDAASTCDGGRDVEDEDEETEFDPDPSDPAVVRALACYNKLSRAAERLTGRNDALEQRVDHLKLLLATTRARDAKERRRYKEAITKILSKRAEVRALVTFVIAKLVVAAQNIAEMTETM
jgi:hypothetical protein